MSERLDTPDGLVVTSVVDSDGPALEFYTGRWQIRYDRDEVMELAETLIDWLKKTDHA